MPCTFNAAKHSVEFHLPPLAAPASDAVVAEGEDAAAEGEAKTDSEPVVLDKDVTVSLCLESGHDLETVAPMVLSYYGV